MIIVIMTPKKLAMEKLRTSADTAEPGWVFLAWKSDLTVTSFQFVL